VDVALGATPAYHPVAHHANFLAAFSASAFCRVEGAIDFAEVPTIARQGVAGFVPKP